MNYYKVTIKNKVGSEYIYSEESKEDLLKGKKLDALFGEGNYDIVLIRLVSRDTYDKTKTKLNEAETALKNLSINTKDFIITPATIESFLLRDKIKQLKFDLNYMLPST